MGVLWRVLSKLDLCFGKTTLLCGGWNVDGQHWKQGDLVGGAASSGARPAPQLPNPETSSHKVFPGGEGRAEKFCKNLLVLGVYDGSREAGWLLWKCLRPSPRGRVGG